MIPDGVYCSGIFHVSIVLTEYIILYFIAELSYDYFGSRQDEEENKEYEGA